MSEAVTAHPWKRVIGIVGGMGPHAHLEFERRLLAAIGYPSSDQDYPEWVVSSVPQTPDRTVALLEGGPSPLPWLLRSLERLACADFAVLACVTAHAFLDEVRAQVRLPILDMIEVTLAEVARRFGPDARTGLLATTGALRSRIFQRTAARLAPGLDLVSLLDLPDGGTLQDELLMRPVYGPLRDGRRQPGGIKCGGSLDPETAVAHRDTLAVAVRHLAGAGAVCVVTGCTEIPLALGRDPVDGTPLLDPMDLAARTAVRIARGELPLPAK
ncbi:MAG TPA: aspartate/glutamate racemase family protein [Thermoanaerobaculia bacterium]|nr:aspartate/glutamate racemase family protein [Thermoanaerobaculia bacterium]